MSSLFGIHIGNSSACVAHCKDDDRVDVIANDAGERVTPVLVQWQPSNCTVGRAALLEQFRYTTCTITRNKQLLNDGISASELEALKSQLPYKINRTEAGFKYELLHDGRQFHVLPRDIATAIFKKIYNIAECAVGGDKDLSAVLTVPVYYSSKSLELVQEIATRAGFNVIQIIDEPCAAILGAGLTLTIDAPPCCCLVYRVGGVSIDATILDIKQGMMSVLGNVHKHSIGGRTLTDKLAEFLAAEFNRLYRGTEIRERGRHKLWSAAESVKQILSIQHTAQCSADSVGDGLDLNMSVSRARFDNLISSILQQMVAPLQQVLHAAQLSVSDIHKVVVCGGTLKTPKLQELVRQMFANAEFVVGPNLSSDEVISLGAARQATYASKYEVLPEGLALDVPILNTNLTLLAQSCENDDAVKWDVAAVAGDTVIPFRRHYKTECTENSLSLTVEANSVAIGSLSLDELDPAVPTTVHVDLDINKDGKLSLTMTNEVSKKKAHLKLDLQECNT